MALMPVGSGFSSGSLPFSNRDDDCLNGIRRILMLPEAEDQPASLCELRGCLAVPCPVAVDLGLPVVSIGHRCDEVLGAAVPEAPVDEDSDPKPCEHDGSPSAQSGSIWRVVDAEAKSGGMEEPSQSDLRLGVPSSVAEHRSPCALAARRRHGERHPPMLDPWILPKVRASTHPGYRCVQAPRRVSCSERNERRS